MDLISDMYGGTLGPGANAFKYENGKLTVVPVPSRAAPDMTPRRVNTVPIDPRTGLPLTWVGAIPVTSPTAANGTLLANKDQSRLPSEPRRRPAPYITLAEMMGGGGRSISPMPSMSPATSGAVAAATALAGADPGDGGLFGIKQSYFPTQQPPAGVAPTKWAAPSLGDLFAPEPTQAVGKNGYKYAKKDGQWQQSGSTRAPGVTAAQQYEQANAAAKARAQANATSGYTQSSNSWFNEVTGR